MNRLADYNYTFMGSSHADKTLLCIYLSIDTLLFLKAEMFTPVSGGELLVVTRSIRPAKITAFYLYQFPNPYKSNIQQ